MSESDVIKVTIDDSELDAALAKIYQINALITEAAGTGGGTTGGEAKGLPGINREMRLILGQLPGMREAMQVYFRISRLARGFEKGDMSMILVTVATFILLLQKYIEYTKQVEQKKLQYEAYIRRERKIDHDEFVVLKAQWENMARNRPG